MKVKVPVILGGYVNGYSLARGFFETNGTSSIVLDYQGRSSRYSRFVEFHECPNPGDPRFLEFLAGLGNELSNHGKQGILLATNDEWMIPVSRQKRALSEIFVVSVSDWDVIERLTIKENFYTLCDEFSIRYPATVIQKNTDFKNVSKLQFPVLCKPSEVVEFIRKRPGERRNRVFGSEGELSEHIEQARAGGFDSPFILQEYIRGGPENLFTVTSCSDSKGRVRALSVGRKLTQTPPEAGTITSGMIDWRPEIAESTVRLLDSIGLVGMANTEYKLDEETGIFHIIETNPRPGMWNYSTLLSGVDMYSILLNDPPETAPILRGIRPAVWSITGTRGILGSIRDGSLKERARNLILSGDVYDPRDCPGEGILYRLAISVDKTRTWIGHRIREACSDRSLKSAKAR